MSPKFSGKNKTPEIKEGITALPGILKLLSKLHS